MTEPQQARVLKSVSPQPREWRSRYGEHATTQGISPEFDEAIRKVDDCLSWEDEEAALDHLGRGWVGEEAVALALYCSLRQPDDYKKTVLRGANTKGDSDSIACIAGGISGARLGAAAIPKEWFMRIEKADQLAVAAERLRLKKRGAAVS